MSSEGIYDRYAATDKFFGLSGASAGTWKVEYFVDHFKDLLPGDRTAPIVEIGCGQGENLAGLRLLGYQNWIGIDISESQLDIARERFQLGGKVEKADALLWLSDRPSSFDCILAVDVLEHLPLDELIAMGHAIRTALKPHGKCLVQVPNGVSPMNPIRDGDITHHRAFTVQSLGQFLLLVGLEPVAFKETPPRSHTLKGMLRLVVWKSLLRPILKLLMVGMHGPTAENVFTANMIGVGEKSSAADRSV